MEVTVNLSLVKDIVDAVEGGPSSLSSSDSRTGCSVGSSAVRPGPPVALSPLGEESGLNAPGLLLMSEFARVRATFREEQEVRQRS